MTAVLLVAACSSAPTADAPSPSTPADAGESAPSPSVPSTTGTSVTETSATGTSDTGTSTTGTSTTGTSTTGSAVSPTCSTEPVDDVVYRTIEGVDPQLLSVDIDPVSGRCDAPVAIWVHGGGWRSGDKANGAAQRAAFYNDQGWLLVSVNYRLTTPQADPPVQFPDHNTDVAAAIAWVDEQIARFGGDPSTTLLVGHSAGASIVAAVAADPGYLGTHGIEPDHLDCVVLLDSAGYDVAAAAQSELEGIYRAAFGDDPAVWRAASPIEHVGDGPLPARTLVVTRGGPRRVAAAGEFSDALRAEGTDVGMVDVSPLSHGDVNALIGSSDDTMTPLLTEELQRCDR